MPDQVVDIDQLKGLRNLAIHRFHDARQCQACQTDRREQRGRKSPHEQFGQDELSFADQLYSVRLQIGHDKPCDDRWLEILRAHTFPASCCPNITAKSRPSG
jgi:hypothetical protein